MEAARQAWLAERHEAVASYDRLPQPHELTVYLPGDVIAIAVGEETQEDTVKAALAGWTITEMRHAEETHDRFVRAVKKAVKKAQ